MDQNKATQDILAIVQFLKDNAASKADLNRFATKDDLQRLATKDDLSHLESRMREHVETRLMEAKTEIMTHVDSFIVLHQKLETELTALRSKYDRLEHHIQQLAKHLQLSLQ